MVASVAGGAFMSIPDVEKEPLEWNDRMAKVRENVLGLLKLLRTARGVS